MCIVFSSSLIFHHAPPQKMIQGVLFTATERKILSLLLHDIFCSGAMIKNQIIEEKKLHLTPIPTILQLKMQLLLQLTDMFRLIADQQKEPRT